MIYRCSKCGSTDIQVRAWIRANDNAVHEWCDDTYNGVFECWCEDCQEMTEVEFKEN